jgi:NifU-like protein
VDDHEDGALICKCFGIDEGMIERAVRMNRLTRPEQVTDYTKASGSCGTCVEGVEAVLARVNAAMVTEGLIAQDVAFDPAAARRPAKPAKKVSPLGPAPQAPPKKELTTLQRIRLIEQSIDELRPLLKRDGGDCELVDVEGDKVMIRLSGSCVGCQAASVTIEGVQQRLMDKVGRPLRVVPVPAGM